MEALLRHRRQKITKLRKKQKRRIAVLFPGGPHIFAGKNLAGLTILFIAITAALLLVWNGFYFKDPRYAFHVRSLWKLIPPLAVLGFLALVNIRRKIPGRSKSYYILPPELHLERREEQEASTEAAGNSGTQGREPEGKEQPDPFGAFLDRL
jgi:hypothetical protein